MAFKTLQFLYIFKELGSFRFHSRYREFMLDGEAHETDSRGCMVSVRDEGCPGDSFAHPLP